FNGISTKFNFIPSFQAPFKTCSKDLNLILFSRIPSFFTTKIQTQEETYINFQIIKSFLSMPNYKRNHIKTYLFKLQVAFNTYKIQVLWPKLQVSTTFLPKS
ncbi:hypothetical protein RYX36_000863, partial [Vicia faba]